MDRYEKTFSLLASHGETAFIPFAVAGDPDRATSERIFRAYIDGGADILEIGYPFSDPIADGPVNQRAARRAIAAGLTHERFFSLVKKLRQTTDIPFGLLCYANTVLHYGAGRFCRAAADAGLDSLLVADMPPEESAPLQKAMRENGLGRVFIVSELTPPGRMAAICRNIDSFVYVVSRLGPTGASAGLSASLEGTLGRLKRVTRRPLAVGFGISTPGQVRAAAAAGADAVIVGSALVAVIEENLDNKKNLPLLLRKKVAAFKKATFKARHGGT